MLKVYHRFADVESVLAFQLTKLMSAESRQLTGKAAFIFGQDILFCEEEHTRSNPTLVYSIFHKEQKLNRCLNLQISNTYQM